MVDVDASFATSLSASPVLVLRDPRNVSASFLTGLSGAVDLSIVRSRRVGASLQTALDGNVDLSVVRSRKVSAALQSSLVASMGLTASRSRSVCAAFQTALAGSVNLSGASDRRGKTLCELVRESLSLWGFLCSKNAPQYALERAITDINTALQIVWNNADGHDYWSNETLTITLADGESSAALTDTVQNVVGPCRRADNNRPLSPLKTIGELETFIDIYLNGETTEEPLAYHIERLKQSADDPAKCVLHVVPAVSGDSVSFLLEVVKECPRYTVGDLSTCPLVPIPHQYAETLLIPIIRHHASSFYLFSETDKSQKQTIDREYQQAMVSLGLADPNPVKNQEGGDK